MFAPNPVTAFPHVVDLSKTIKRASLRTSPGEGMATFSSGKPMVNEKVYINDTQSTAL
jgi:hypothetical protein